MNRKKFYSYQDCWRHAFPDRKRIVTGQTKNDIIALCRTDPEHFWLTFSNKVLPSMNYAKICYNLDKYFQKNYPVPYLTKQIYFFALPFYIEKGVFIPQKDTEILVEKTLELADKIWTKKEQLKILDIGTGCGNIVISLAKNRSNWNFTALDKNKKALKIAENNAVVQKVKNIKFVFSNLFKNLSRKEKFNIIVANPPYVSANDYKNVRLAVKKQPKEALVAKKNGYFFYQKIFAKGRYFLKRKFLLVIEIGYQQKENIIKLIIKHLPKAEVSIFSDWEGHSRTVAIFQL